MTLAGSLSFEETINMPGLEEQDTIQAGWELDDLHVGIINSRKLNVKALVTLPEAEGVLKYRTSDWG